MFEEEKSVYNITDAHIHPVWDDSETDFSLFGFKTSPEMMVQTLRSAGISRAAGSVIRRIYAVPQWEEIHTLNLAALEFQRLYPDFYIPGIHIHPAYPEKSLAEVETMHKDHQVKLIGELVAYLMGYDGYSVPALDAVWETIRDFGMTVNIHIASLEDAEALLKKFPTLKLIIAHPTANPAEYTARLELIARYPNTALDISGSGPNSWNMVRHGLKTAGPEKIIFGTDFPLRNPGMYVAGVLFEELSEAERKAVFSENFDRLLNS